MSAPVADLIMWAPLVRSRRSVWIYHSAIRSTRKGSRAAYLSWASEEFREKAAKELRRDIRTGRVRFVKVRVSIEPPRGSVWDTTNRRFKKVV